MLASVLAMFLVAFTATAANAATVEAENFDYATVVNDGGVIAAKVNSNNGTIPQTYAFQTFLNAHLGQYVNVCARARTNATNGVSGFYGSIQGTLFSGVKNSYGQYCTVAYVRDTRGLVQLTSGSYTADNRATFFDWLSVS